MAPRFYYDLVSPSEDFVDEVGAECETFERAIELAHKSIDQMKARGELEEQSGGWALIVRDATGSQWERLPINGAPE